MNTPTIIDFFNKFIINPFVGLMIMLVFIVVIAILVIYTVLINDPLDINDQIDE